MSKAKNRGWGLRSLGGRGDRRNFKGKKTKSTKGKSFYDKTPLFMRERDIPGPEQREKGGANSTRFGKTEIRVPLKEDSTNRKKSARGRRIMRQ